MALLVVYINITFFYTYLKNTIIILFLASSVQITVNNIKIFSVISTTTTAAASNKHINTKISSGGDSFKIEKKTIHNEQRQRQKDDLDK